MQKVNMLCHSYYGARDLYHGVPDLEGAIVEKVEYVEGDVCTILRLKRSSGEIFKMGIMPSE